MALNPAWPQIITLGTASADITSASYTEIALPTGADGPSSQQYIGAQALRIGATINAAGSVTVRFALTDGTTVFDYVDVVCTATTATALANNTGTNLKCTVAGTNDRFIDLLGYDLKNPPFLKWKVGPVSYTGASSGTLYLWPTRTV